MRLGRSFISETKQLGCRYGDLDDQSALETDPVRARVPADRHHSVPTVGPGTVRDSLSAGTGAEPGGDSSGISASKHHPPFAACPALK